MPAHNRSLVRRPSSSASTRGGSRPRCVSWLAQRSGPEIAAPQLSAVPVSLRWPPHRAATCTRRDGSSSHDRTLRRGRGALALYTAPADNTTVAAPCDLAQQQLPVVGVQDIDGPWRFPRWCWQAADLRRSKRADLHLHNQRIDSRHRHEGSAGPRNGPHSFVDQSCAQHLRERRFFTSYLQTVFTPNGRPVEPGACQRLGKGRASGCRNHSSSHRNRRCRRADRRCRGRARACRHPDQPGPVGRRGRSCPSGAWARTSLDRGGQAVKRNTCGSA